MAASNIILGQQQCEDDSKREHTKRVRLYFIDWIRALAINLVIFIHAMMNAADTVDLKDRNDIEKKEGIVKVLV